MKRLPSARASLWLGGIACAGVALAHSVAYRLAAPDPHAAARLLESTGHRYWGSTVLVAAILALGGLAGFGTNRWRSAPAAATGTLVWRYARRLTWLQAGLFLVLEATERGLASTSPVELLSEPAVRIGLALVVVVALLGALALALLAAAIDVLRGALGARPGPRTSLAARYSSQRGAACPRPVADGWSLRGPPVPSCH